MRMKKQFAVAGLILLAALFAVPSAVLAEHEKHAACGLAAWTRHAAPERVDAVGGSVRNGGGLHAVERAEADEWEQYGSSFLYNQMNRVERALWDALNETGLLYLVEEEDAKDYGAWRGTEGISYDGFTEEEAKELLLFYLYSNPQYYFFLPAYAIESSGGEQGVLWLQIDDRFADGETRARETKRLKAAIEESVARVCAEKTEFAREKAAHDLICGMVEYDYNFEHKNLLQNQTVYSTFLTGKTVCAGYAQAMALLCNAAGVDCISVTSEAHQWNMMRINGSWHCTDLTWDDGEEGEIYYQYFNRSAEMMRLAETGEEGNEGENHTPLDEWNAYLPPAVRDSGADYWNPGTVYVPKAAAEAPEIFIDALGVAFLSQPEGAEIYYTTDGGEPSVARTKSDRYGGIFDVGKGTTVKAIAVKDGFWDSEAAEVSWEAETARAYAGQTFLIYVKPEGATRCVAEGLEAFSEGASAAEFDEAAGRFCWTPETDAVGKTYELRVTAYDGNGEGQTETVRIQVADPLVEAFAITGPQEMKLTEGYEDACSGSFAISGRERCQEVLLSGNTGAGAIVWKHQTRQVEVRAGLKAGLYPLTLTAKSEAGEEAMCDFWVRVAGNDTGNHLPEFVSPQKNLSAHAGRPLLFYVRAQDVDLGDAVSFGSPDFKGPGGQNHVQFDRRTGRFSWTPDPALAGQTATVTFTAYDALKQPVRHTVTIQVKSAEELRAEPFAVIGQEAMELREGYAKAQTDSFVLTGMDAGTSFAPVAWGLPDTYSAYFDWDERTRQLIVREGLSAGDYEVRLYAPGQEAFYPFSLHITENSREELLAVCAQAREYAAGEYLSEGRAQLSAVLEAVRHIREDEGAAEEWQRRAIAALRDAIERLETLPEAWSRRSAAYRKAKEEHVRYTQKSWDAYWSALTAADDLPEDFTEEMLMERLAALAFAYRSLEEAPPTGGAVSGPSSVRQIQEAPEPSGAQQTQETYVELGGIRYRMIQRDRRQAAVQTGVNPDAAALAIADFVTIDGITCSVVEIEADAFRGFRKLKRVMIGKQVRTIGRNSFYGCKKLKKVTLKGKKIASIKAGAFYNTHARLKISLPKQMKDRQKQTLKKKLKRAGAGKKAVVR